MDESFAEVSLIIKMKINEAKNGGEITAETGNRLEVWWDRFVNAFALPSSTAANRMWQIIREGKESFGNLRIYENIIAIFGFEIRTSCSGDGMIKCYRCDGLGYCKPDLPSSYVGSLLLARSTCDKCFGRGKEICTTCKGIGVRHK
ncbi:MAG: hypothetical protein JSW07_07315 [bacterium]|nr:MAG: hypothetical protein JSW07_07315 [bacterium]